MDPTICTAVARRQLLMFGYKGVVRVAEPHLYGRLADGREALSAWMRPGWSRTSPEGGWRLFHADALERVQGLPELFGAPRPDFNPEDPHFAEVFCRLAPPDAGAPGEAPGDAPPTPEPAAPAPRRPGA
jgi:hypothetical protein